MKPKPLTEAQFLALLERALAKIVARDHQLRAAIHDEVTKEIRLHNHVASFEKFCEKGSVPDLKPETVAELQDQLAATFGSDASVSVTPDEKNGGLMDVEIVLPDRTVTSRVKVDPEAATADDGQPKAPFVPFPVALPTDTALVWVLARREDLGPDEAARALANIEEEFWASKHGQQLQRKGGEKTFAEFIARVPSAALLESGLKRHYKEPETLHSLRQLAGGSSPSNETKNDHSLDALFSDEKPVKSRRDVQNVQDVQDVQDVQGKPGAEATASQHPLDEAESGEDDAPWD